MPGIRVPCGWGTGRSRRAALGTCWWALFLVLSLTPPQPETLLSIGEVCVLCYNRREGGPHPLRSLSQACNWMEREKLGTPSSSYP